MYYEITSRWRKDYCLRSGQEWPCRQKDRRNAEEPEHRSQFHARCRGRTWRPWRYPRGMSIALTHSTRDTDKNAQHDVLFFISYSGKTPELLNLLPHLPRQLQIVALTSQSKASECPLLKEHENGILLPAPLFELEEVSFGVSAPTTSTTVQIAIGDMLALTVADQLHENKGKTFKKNHPGGAIGAVTRESAKSIADARQQPVAPLEVVPLELPSPSLSAQSDS